jgi:hypothetical protein
MGATASIEAPNFALGAPLQADRGRPLSDPSRDVGRGAWRGERAASSARCALARALK